MADAQVLPTDPFDRTLSEKLGHQDGAHTQPATVQDVDFYGNVTTFILQTVRHAKGTTAFLTQVNATGSARYILPPKVLALIARQQEALTTTVRRRHGKRIAYERKLSGHAPTFTPEQRAKALATRKRNAAKRRKARAAK